MGQISENPDDPVVRSSTEIREIIYHCECRCFVPGTPQVPCFCHVCGREHVPGPDTGAMAGGPQLR